MLNKDIRDAGILDLIILISSDTSLIIEISNSVISLREFNIFVRSSIKTS